MKKSWILIGAVWYYILGNIFSVIYYDRKYLKGKYFTSKHGKLFGRGWKWATVDGISRVLFQVNKKVPWPVSPKVTVSHPQNISFDVDDMHIFHTYGTYFQAKDSKIIIGKGAWIAPNVGFITANHDIHNIEKHVEGKSIVIGEKCWIGMNSVLLPGVTLGSNTIVGAGSVVTKSFADGNCVIAGNPAKIIKKL